MKVLGEGISQNIILFVYLCYKIFFVRPIVRPFFMGFISPFCKLRSPSFFHI